MLKKSLLIVLALTLCFALMAPGVLAKGPGSGSGSGVPGPVGKGPGDGDGAGNSPFNMTSISIDVTVYGTQGGLVEGAMVQIVKEDTIIADGETNEDGIFSVSGLTGFGDLLIQAKYPGGDHAAQVSGNATLELRPYLGTEYFTDIYLQTGGFSWDPTFEYGEE